MNLTEQKLQFKTNKLIKQLLEGVYAPDNWSAIPDINTQAEYLYNLAIFSAKKGIDDFDRTIGELKPVYKGIMIKTGVEYMQDKINEIQYITTLEKCLSKQAGKKIILEPREKLNIEIRLRGNRNYPKLKNNSKNL